MDELKMDGRVNGRRVCRRVNGLWVSGCTDGCKDKYMDAC